MTYFLDDEQMTHVGALRGTPAEDWTVSWLTGHLMAIGRGVYEAAFDGGEVEPGDALAATLFRRRRSDADEIPEWAVGMWDYASQLVFEEVTRG